MGQTTSSEEGFPHSCDTAVAGKHRGVLGKPGQDQFTCNLRSNIGVDGRQVTAWHEAKLGGAKSRGILVDLNRFI